MWTQNWMWLEEPRVLLSRGILRVSSGSDVVHSSRWQLKPLNSDPLFWGQSILAFSVLKGISCLILVEAEETAFLDAILAGGAGYLSMAGERDADADSLIWRRANWITAGPEP